MKSNTSGIEAEILENQIKQFKVKLPHYQVYARLLEEMLVHLTNRFTPAPVIQTRIKSISNFAEKIQRKGYDNPFEQMTDICGCRIIVNTTEEKEIICKLIEENFDVDLENSMDLRQRLKPTEFGYSSIHYIIQLDPDKMPALFQQKELDENFELLSSLKAEIQIRTRIENSYADFVHEHVYKSKYDIPEKWHHDLAAVAAMLERVDSSFLRIKKGIEAYTSSYSNYMPAEDIRKEIELLENVLELSDEKEEKLDLVYRIGQLALAIKSWDKIIDLHSEYVKDICSTENKNNNHFSSFIVRDLGIAMCKKYSQTPNIKGYKDGLKYLKQAMDENSEDLQTIVSYADALEVSVENWHTVQKLYSKAFEYDSSDYYSLTKYILYEANANRTLSFLKHLKPSIKYAIQRAEEHIEFNMNIPQVYFYVGLLYYFNGELNKSLRHFTNALLTIKLNIESYHQYIPDSKTYQNNIDDYLLEVKSYQELIDLIIVSSDHPEGVDMVYDMDNYKPLSMNCIKKIIDLFLKSILNSLESNNSLPEKPIVIVAGSCGSNSENLILSYRDSLCCAFKDFDGTIISGGTKAGICGLIGEIQEFFGDRITTYGYLPKSKEYLSDDRYRNHITTAGSNFSVLEPIKYWEDLLERGFSPSDVTVFGIGGGEIATIEYRIALALGAKVAVIIGGEDKGNFLVSDVQKLEQLTGFQVSLINLPNDRWTIRKFMEYSSFKNNLTIDSEIIEEIAQRDHANSRDNKLKKAEKTLEETDDSVKPWGKLREEFKNSSRLRAKDTEIKLQAAGFKLKRSNNSEIDLIEFTDDEIEILAEMEHGRWNAERLLEGWKHGSNRDPDSKTSPHLVPWDNLPDEIKEYDRRPLRKVPENLAKYGYEIIRVNESK